MNLSAEQHEFATTQWSIVLRAARPDDSAARFKVTPRTKAFIECEPSGINDSSQEGAT